MRVSSHSIPFINGLFVALDAIPDAHLVVDGPYCVSKKAEMQALHNLNSTLRSAARGARYSLTIEGRRIEEVDSTSLDRAAGVEAVVAEAMATGAAAVLVTAFDFAHMTGLPLKIIAERATGARGVPVHYIESASLSGDWLDGYRLVVEALADELPLSTTRRRPRSVALVGYLWDRGEFDHLANISELRRLLSRLGIELVSVWLSGEPYGALTAIEEASVVVSLPYARRAAQRVAERTGATLLEADLPLGLGATERLLRGIVASAGIDEPDLLTTVLDEELGSAVRATEQLILGTLAGRVARVHLDDHLGAAMGGLCEELGLTVSPASSTTTPQAGQTSVTVFADEMRGPAVAVEDEDLLICATLPHDTGLAHFPFGYPNYCDHPCSERPFMGFAGFRCLVEGLASCLLRWEHLEGLRRKAP